MLQCPLNLQQSDAVGLSKAQSVIKKQRLKPGSMRINCYSCCALIASRPVYPALRLTVVEVETVGTVGDARVGAFSEVEPRPACRALVTTVPDAGLAHGGALLAALLIVTEKATGTLGHTHPAER